MARDLGLGASDAWEMAWERFAESPAKYPGLPERLRAARPKPKKSDAPTFWDKPGRWPQENEEAEAALRDALNALGDAQPTDARARLAELEQEHGRRRDWVWSALGQGPLAAAMVHLGALAAGTAMPLTAASAAGLMAQYADFGWKTDDAALRALASVERQADVSAVKAAVRAVYRPWLENGAAAFQLAVNTADFAAAYPMTPLPAWPAGTCVVFCDGLRLDLAHRLEDMLTTVGFSTSLATRLTALPSITTTAKPAVSPVAAALGGSPSLDPAVIATDATVNVGVLRSQLEAAGYQCFTGDEIGDPAGRAWAEATNVDNIGHNETAKLPRIAETTMREVAERIASLLDGGWKQVVVVTDHGWLYLPGGLPKADLEVGLAEHNMRKGRCARLKDGATTDLVTVPWHWDKDVRVAMAPGICCFQSGKVYEHGGLSPQECVTPVLTVSKPLDAAGGGGAALAVKWRNMRCDFEAENAPVGSLVDIRSKAGDAATSLLAQPRVVKDDGSVSAPVEDDSLEGHAAFAVLVAPDGLVLAQVATTVGGEG